MDSETKEQSNNNLGSSSTTRDQSTNFQTNEYFGYFYWTAYYHYMNQRAMMNFPSQARPLNLTESQLNPNHLLVQQYNYAPTPASSPTPFAYATSSSNMKDLCRCNPSNSSANGKNLRTDNKSLKFRPNCDEWNLRANINEYTANDASSNQCAISEDFDDDNCSQTIAVYDNDLDEGKKQMAIRKEMTKVIKRCSSHQIDPINQSQFKDKYQTNDYVIVNENQMDEIIARELDLALSKKHRRHSRGHRHNNQKKEKSRSKTEKKSITRDKLISVTVERIKAAVFSSNPNPSNFQKNKTSDLEENQQSKQIQSFIQPEYLNQYRANNASGQFQYSKSMVRPKPEVVCQPADLKHTCNSYCTCKSSDTRMSNDLSSSSISASNHSNQPFDNITRMDHSVYALLHR